MDSFYIICQHCTKEKVSANSISNTSIAKADMTEDKMNLTEVNIGEEYIIKEIVVEDEELTAFLFSLGCYSGEPITVVSRLRSGCVVAIKDGRYHIDRNLARAITV